MSKVIVGFDFSKGSAYAVDLAIDVANKFQQDLCLVYVKEKDQDEGPIREEIERRNAGVAHLLNGIKMDYVIREGKVSRELCEQAREDNAFLIVVGTHGMSGFEKNWIGRNTYRTIAEAPAPVLTIREDFNIHKSYRCAYRQFARHPSETGCSGQLRQGIRLRVAHTGFIHF